MLMLLFVSIHEFDFNLVNFFQCNLVHVFDFVDSRQGLLYLEFDVEVISNLLLRDELHGSVDVRQCLLQTVSLYGAQRSQQLSLRMPLVDLQHTVEILTGLGEVVYLHEHFCPLLLHLQHVREVRTAH